MITASSLPKSTRGALHLPCSRGLEIQIGGSEATPAPRIPSIKEADLDNTINCLSTTIAESSSEDTDHFFLFRFIFDLHTTKNNSTLIENYLNRLFGAEAPYDHSRWVAE